jgi:hypothetical protein
MAWLLKRKVSFHSRSPGSFKARVSNRWVVQLTTQYHSVPSASEAPDAPRTCT